MAIDPAPAALPAGLSAHAFSSLFHAVAGLRNRRAIVALLGCLFVGVIVASLLAMMAPSVGFSAFVMATLIWVVAIGTGVNAAACCRWITPRGISQRSTVDALATACSASPSCSALGLIFFAAVLAGSSPSRSCC
jgi:hypothetical protein